MIKELRKSTINPTVSIFQALLRNSLSIFSTSIPMIMEDFVKAIRCEDKTYFFLFSEVEISNGRKFFVTTGKEGRNVFFEVVCDELGSWKIIGQLPQWVREIEVNIIDA